MIAANMINNFCSLIIIKYCCKQRWHTKGGFFSESDEGFSKLPKYVPKTYLVLFNAVHSVDKMSNLYLFVFTGLIDSHSIHIDLGTL